MATMTPKQREDKLNALIHQAATKFDAFTDQQTLFALRELRRTENILIGRLAEAVGPDGAIKRERLNALLTDVRGLRREISADLNGAMDRTIRTSADRAFADLAEAYGKSQLDGLVSAGIDYNRLNENVVKYVTQRYSEDGLVLSDRIWRMSGRTTSQLNTVVRNAIIQGEGLTTAIAQVRAVYDAGTHAIRRLVVTEANTAYRAAFAQNAQESEVVEYIRIHRGEADRPNHQCSILEEEDRHGAGAGLFLPEDSDVFNPHPNCTSYLTYELNYELLSTGIRQEEIEDAVDPETETEFNIDNIRTNDDIIAWGNASGINATFANTEIEYAREFVAAAEKVFDRYPELREFVRDYNDVMKSRSGTYAYSSGRDIRFNPGIFGKNHNTAARRQAMYDEKYVSKFGSTSTPAGVAYHELGHALENLFEKHGITGKIRAGTFKGADSSQSYDFVPQMLKDLKIRKADIPNELSKYGKTKPYETWAEGFGEFFESDNPRAIARAVGARADELIAQIRKGG